MTNWVSDLIGSLFHKKERKKYFLTYYREKTRKNKEVMQKRRERAYFYKYHKPRPKHPKQTSPRVI